MSFIDIIEKTVSWDDIYQNFITSNDLSKAGKNFEHFAKLYFLCEPTVRNEFKNAWLFSEAPLNIKEKLGLGNRDHGIDLILEDHEGFLSVVQCKFKQDQSSSVSWAKDKLSHLFADGDKADFFIIFTNASRIDTHTRSKKPNKLSVFMLDKLIDISSETIEVMRLFSLGQEPALQTKKFPKDYQKIAIDKVIEGFETSDRGQLILPCGAGKTLISLWIQERLNPNYTLVLFPSLALLRQTKNEWAANRKQYMPYICVCSEKDIDKKGDNAQIHLSEISASVSTDPNEIRDYLQSHKQAIVFSTYQSLKVVAEAIKDTEIVFDLALCDEAHKTAGSKKSSFGLMHDDSKIRINKRLYMTATPRVLGETAKNRLRAEEVEFLADMSDPKIFGPEFHHMNFKEAIDKGILVDYKIIAMGVSDAEIAAVIKERNYINDDVTADEIANNYALEKFMKKHESGHAITFHSSVAKAQSFQKRHREFFNDIETFHVNGTQTTNDRNVILKAFKHSSKSVVTNARCLTEGVDIPVIDAVYFCDPKNSKIDIVQAAGRALRKAEGKTLGYIVVPIFQQNKENVENAIEEGVFNNLISVVRALSSHDERLVDEIKAIKLGSGARSPHSGRIAIQDVRNLITIEDMGDLSDHLFDQVISKFRLPWRPFEEARAFVRRLGLKSKEEWSIYRDSGKKPDDIPNDPYSVFKDKGWISWGDWLGTGTIASHLKEYLTFEEARAYVHTLGLKSVAEWKRYCKSGIKPDNIPTSPVQTYKDKGWISWGDFLGTGRIANYNMQYWPFEKARSFVHTLGLKSGTEWKKYCAQNKLPANIPKDPFSYYKDTGWISWGDWLGTGSIAPSDKKYLPFEEARAFAHTLNLRSKKEWQAYCKKSKQDNIPVNPEQTYKNKGWISWGDWLGTGRVANFNAQYLSFEAAKVFVHSLNLKSREEWKAYCKNGNKPSNIPNDPYGVYRDSGWVGWGDWLGTGREANFNMQYWLFAKAKLFVRSLNLKSRVEWQAYCKSGQKPKDIPKAPDHYYKDKGWAGWKDWLGTNE